MGKTAIREYLIRLSLKDILITFVEDLVNFIKSEIDNTLEDPTISARLCVISFKFNDMLIDLNIVGYSPYLHSLLFRIYNLLDARYSMLVLCNLSVVL